MITPTATALNQALQALHPEHLELINESVDHAGYFEGKECPRTSDSCIHP